MCRFMVVAVMVVCVAATVACGKNSGGGSAMTRQDLLGRRFALVSVDGKDFSAKERAPSIEFNEGLRISGAACNRFAGQGRLAGNVLTMEKGATTRMLCMDPDLNELDDLLARMLVEGAELHLDKQNLVLRQGGHELLYKLTQ